ncbi:hypothetical protein M0813_17636 [Anaeramoeba flamelloides]|uniref:Myb-like domain-containing protein n=1 Tax=Anaeramoeba flamelloides TaxID=1746091 RepID=A0ABQ8YVE2_9EUKA|nr:hypothetical protein M0813_17636 [Anaeramoeba flamelloides]
MSSQSLIRTQIKGLLREMHSLPRKMKEKNPDSFNQQKEIQFERCRIQETIKILQKRILFNEFYEEVTKIKKLEQPFGWYLFNQFEDQEDVVKGLENVEWEKEMRGLCTNQQTGCDGLNSWPGEDWDGYIKSSVNKIRVEMEKKQKEKEEHENQKVTDTLDKFEFENNDDQNKEKKLEILEDKDSSLVDENKKDEETKEDKEEEMKEDENEKKENEKEKENENEEEESDKEKTTKNKAINPRKRSNQFDSNSDSDFVFEDPKGDSDEDYKFSDDTDDFIVDDDGEDEEDEYNDDYNCSSKKKQKKKTKPKAIKTEEEEEKEKEKEKEKKKEKEKEKKHPSQPKKKNNRKKNRSVIKQEYINKPEDAPNEWFTWCLEKKRAWGNYENKPNQYFYRFNEKGEKTKVGKWSKEEDGLFIKRCQTHKPGKDWGIFSKTIPGRCGYVCANYYRRKMKQDPNFLQKHGKNSYKMIDGNLICVNGRGQKVGVKKKKRTLEEGGFSRNEKELQEFYNKKILELQEFFKQQDSLKQNRKKKRRTGSRPKTKGTKGGSRSGRGSGRRRKKKRLNPDNGQNTMDLSTGGTALDKQDRINSKRNQKAYLSSSDELLEEDYDYSTEDSEISEMEINYSELDESEEGEYQPSSSKNKVRGSNEALTVDNINPLPGFVDQIIQEPCKIPTLSPSGYVFDWTTWNRILNSKPKNTCPMTRQKITRRQLIKLTPQNIETYYYDIINNDDKTRIVLTKKGNNIVKKKMEPKDK